MQIVAEGLVETIAWLKAKQKGIPAAIKEETTGTTTLTRLTRQAKSVVETVVYAAYSPAVYERTMNLLNAVGAVKLGDNPPETGICIDLTPDTIAKGTRNYPNPDITYAQFFLPDGAKPSFIPQKAMPLRDFMGIWLNVFGELLPLEMRRAINEELGKS